MMYSHRLHNWALLAQHGKSGMDSTETKLFSLLLKPSIKAKERLHKTNSPQASNTYF